MRLTWRGWFRQKLVMPMTLLSLVVTFVMLGVYQGVGAESREAFLGVAAGLAAFVLLDLGLIVYEEWQAWPWIVDRLRAWRLSAPGSHRPRRYAATLYYPIHLVDVYVGLTLAFGLLALGLWVLDQSADKSRFYLGFDVVITTRNIWQLWVMFTATASFVGNGVGFATFVPRHWAPFLVYWANNVTLFLYVTLVANILLGWYFAKDHDNHSDTHDHADLVEQGQSPVAPPTPEQLHALWLAWQQQQQTSIHSPSLSQSIHTSSSTHPSSSSYPHPHLHSQRQQQQYTTAQQQSAWMASQTAHDESSVLFDATRYLS